MPFARPVLALTLLLSSQLISACSAPVQNNNSSNSAVSNASNVSNSGPRDNVEEFADLVRLPFAPEEVAWKEAAGGKSVTAVVRFSPANAAKMAAEIAKNGQPTAEELTEIGRASL